MSYEIGLEVALILCAAVLGLVLAHRFKQEVVLGEIVLGIIIGPTLLGIIHYDDTVRILAELGAIFLLFMVGLQCNYKTIYTFRNSAVALVGVILPFVAGWGLARLFGYQSIEAMFIGVALTATSIAITARVLEERGLLSKEFAKTILGAAVLDDILSLLLLSVVSGTIGDFTWGAVGFQVLLVFLFVGGALILIKPVNALIHHIDKYAKSGKQVMIFAALIIAFGYAGIAELIGLSSIIGAFLAGVSVDPIHLSRLKQGTAYFEMLFAAIFFVSLGILTDLSAMSGAWTFAIILTVAAILSKMIGGFVPAKFTGHSFKESLVIGTGMVPRGEVTMIVALLGLTRGIIGPEVYGTIIFVAFFTTVVTPPMLGLMFSRFAASLGLPGK